jgi:predicted nucleic acid-binding protein
MGAPRLKSKYLLDSAILIDHLRGIALATKWLKGLRDGEAVISVITRAEVLAGGSPKETAAAFDLCEQFGCLPLTRETADLAAELRRTNGWKLPDAFQAALAIDHGLRLVTRNTKDFREKKHAFALIPYRLARIS